MRYHPFGSPASVSARRADPERDHDDDRLVGRAHRDRGRSRDRARARRRGVLQAHGRDDSSRVDNPRGRYVRRTPRGPLAHARRGGRRCAPLPELLAPPRISARSSSPTGPHLSPIHPQASATSSTPADSARDGTPTPSDPRRPLDGARASPSSPPPATSSCDPDNPASRCARSPILEGPRLVSTRDAPPAPRLSRDGAARARESLLRSVADAADRRLRAAYPSARVPAHATVEDLSEYSVAHFLGRVVHVAAVASRSRRVSVDAMGATARPTLWITQGHGTLRRGDPPRGVRGGDGSPRWRRRRTGGGTSRFSRVASIRLRETLPGGAGPGTSRGARADRHVARSGGERRTRGGGGRQVSVGATRGAALFPTRRFSTRGDPATPRSSTSSRASRG